jgi:hypothetical protein
LKFEPGLESFAKFEVLADIFTQLKLEILNWTELWCELQVQINIF